MSLFALDKNQYVRNLDFHDGYKKSLALYASIMKDVPYDQALVRVNEMSRDGNPLAPKIPEVEMNYRRRARTDREMKTRPLDGVIKEIVDNDLILGPNFVVYENPEVFRSHLGDFIDFQLDRRYTIKKEGQIAKQKGDMDQAEYKGASQVNAKTLNNSISGAHSSPYNPNFLASAHTTLTSSCRVGTSNSNSSAERFMMGNRHYYNPEITLENILASIRLTDPMKIMQAIDTYRLAYPDVEYTVKRVKENTEIYWKANAEWEKIEALIRKLTPLQRAAVIYSADMRSFIDLNPDFTRSMFDDLIMINNQNPEPISRTETDSYIANADGYIMSFVSTLSAKEIAGKVLNDIGNPKEDDYDEDVFCRFGARLKHVTDAINLKYLPLIRAFFTTDLTPLSVHSFPMSVRKCVIGSDTDSTLYTTQSLVEWYMDGLIFNHEADCCRELVTYWNSQLVVHILAKVSRHIGVTDDNLFRMTMKPEFSMPVMAFTNRMKHYYATESACEGNIYETPELVTKGVALKNSKVPRWVINIFNNYLEYLIEIFTSGQKITIQQAVAPVAYLEHRFLVDLKDGKSDFLYNARIKDAAAYQKPESSVLVYKGLWDEVFGPKYGGMGETPVETKKVSVGLTNKTNMNKWLDNIQDPAIADRMRTWLKNNNKDTRTQLLVPQSFLANSPLPEEIWIAINKEKMLAGLTESFYYILETLGIYYKNGGLTRFAFHEMSMEEAKANLGFDIDKLIPYLN